MTGRPDHLQIIGVKHNDRRVPELVEEEVTMPLDQTFHETPESDSSSLKFIFWTLLKNPLAGWMNLIRIALTLISSLIFATRMVLRGKKSQLTLQKDGHVQGRKALKKIEQKYGVSWTPVGMNRIERVRVLPYRLSILSWVNTVFLLLSFYTMTISFLIGVILFSTSTGSAIAASYLIGDVRRPTRDKHIFENIIEGSSQGSRVAVVLGENHVKGIACHAESLGIEYETAWVSSTADIKWQRDSQ